MIRSQPGVSLALVNQLITSMAGKLSKLKFTQVVEVYVGLYAEESPNDVLTLHQLVEAVRLFCTHNVWVHQNGFIDISPVKNDRKLGGIVQCIASDVLNRKFSAPYNKGQWEGVRLLQPSLIVNQERLVEILPGRLCLKNNQGVLQTLPRFGWGAQGPEESQILGACRLGRGSFGRVYEATLMPENRVVAVKFFVGEKATSSAVREAETRMKLQGSVGIVEFLGGCVQYYRPQHSAIRAAPQQISYLVYERCLGDLSVACQFPIQEKLLLLNDIVGGMISLHSRNMVHRDLRVPNILIKQCGVGRRRALVADFGISSVGDGTGQPMDEVAGKERTKRKYWMAPESCSRNEGVWTDIYSVSFLVGYMFLPKQLVLKDLQPTASTPAGRAWKGVIDWIVAARALDVAERQHVSLLHLAYALMKVGVSEYADAHSSAEAFQVVRVSTDVAERPQMAQTPVKKRKAEENRGQLTRGERNFIRAQAGQALLHKAEENREGGKSAHVGLVR